MASPELVTKLTAYIKPGAALVSPADSAFIEDSLDQAIALVDNVCGTSIDLVPMVVLHRAYIEVGADLYARQAAPQGVTQFTSIDGQQTRFRRDPVDGVRPMLTPFLPGGFA